MTFVLSRLSSSMVRAGDAVVDWWCTRYPSITACSTMVVAALGRAVASMHISVVPRLFSTSTTITPQWAACLVGPATIRRPQVPPQNNACSGVCSLHTSATLGIYKIIWKLRTKYTIQAKGRNKTGGRDRRGKAWLHRIGGGHKQRYRMVDFKRERVAENAANEPFAEKVLLVRYDPLRSGHIAMVAGGNQKRWIVATENMQPGQIINTSQKISRINVEAMEGNAHPVGALTMGTLIHNLELTPGKGATLIRAAGTCGLIVRNMKTSVIVQLPSKQQIKVDAKCMATVGRVSNIHHNQRKLGKAGRSRWLGRRPSSGLWQRKGGWAGRKIHPPKPLKDYTQFPAARFLQPA
uniref:Mitochondrial ribosomal protein L2 n=1 Tax=Eptatretus burgeri TaxID=7764 RepID=A0A8C4NCJ9_EPTBU